MMNSVKQRGGLVRVKAGAAAIGMIAVIGMIALTGCEEKPGSTGTTGGLGQQLGDAASKAGKAASDAGAQAVDAAKQGVDQIRTQATSWITDTVEKEWPKAKESLAALDQRVAGLSPELKGRAEGLLNDLKAQVPQIEEMVGRLRTASGTELSGLLTNARTMWDGFMTKLGDLQKMVGA